MELLRIRRKEMGLSQVELAQIVKIPRWRIQLHEQGLVFLSAEEERVIWDLYKRLTQAQLKLKIDEGVDSED